MRQALERECTGAFLMADGEYLERALQLALLGRREAHPNPRVGAVLVAGDATVGEGYHRGPGTPHAEVVALDQAGQRARGATLFVTLEPCCSYGHTGPCTERIIAAGVARVVVGARDPNPAVDANLEALVAAVVREVQSLGHEMVRAPDAVRRDRPIHDLTRHFGM